MANQLYNFQHAGVDHLLSMPFGRPHALLADAPGTGKTIMAIEAAKKAGCKTGIIVCPASVKEQWKRQMMKWELADDDEIQVVYGSKAELDNKPWKVINYDLVRLPHFVKQFTKSNWNVLIPDEAHRLKGYDSQQSGAIFDKGGIGEKCYWKWFLSGSIMPNRSVELYPIMKSCLYDKLGIYKDWTAFLNHFCGFQGRGATNTDELAAILKPFMLRRLLSDVWRDMPAEIEDIQYIHADYEKHPEWLGIGFMPEATERRIIAEAKIPAMAKWLNERSEDDGRAKKVCFAFHRKVIEDLTAIMGQRYACQLYGGMTKGQRESNFNRFISDPDAEYFFIQIGSGGEGLDGLQNVCHNYVKLEPEWSPGRDDQAGDRIMRLGQRQTVFSTQLIVAGSYEDRIYNSNQRKRRPINIITKPNGGDYTTMSVESELQELNKNIKGLLDVLYAGIQQGASPAPGNFAPPVAAPPPVVAPPPPVSAPVASSPSSTAPPAPAPTTKTPERIKFEADVSAKLTPFAHEGVARLQKRLGEYNASHLSEIPETYWPDFLQTV